MVNEFTQDQDETTSISSSKTPAKTNAPRKPLPKWLTYLWDANISPFSIVRWTGPLGPRFTSGWTSRRFSHLPRDESLALHDYAYSLFRQRGSGEYALAYILAPGAFARSPLIRRIHNVGRQPIPAREGEARVQLKEMGIPVILMYGENDWMDVAGGYAAEQKIKEEKASVLANATEEEKQLDNGSAKVVIIQKAGHHLYLEGWEQFNEVIREEMEDVKKHKRKLTDKE